MDNPRLNQLLQNTQKLDDSGIDAIRAKFQALKAKPVEHATKTIRNIRLVHHCGCGSDWSDDYHIVIPEDAAPEDFIFADYFIDEANRLGFMTEEDLATLVKMGLNVYRGNYDGNPSDYNPSEHELVFGMEL